MLPVVIIGAGIAGLTAALALARRGWEVLLLEQADHLAEIGAGLQLSPNATKVLSALGLDAALKARAVEPDSLIIHNAAGDSLIHMPLGAALSSRYGAPFLVIHRADLQALLLEAVQAEPRITLALGICLEGAKETEAFVAVDVWIGEQRKLIEAAALIGADGVRSSVRMRIMAGPVPFYSGYTAWRATFPATRYPHLAATSKRIGLWLGPRAHIVHYPIRGGERINLVVVVEEQWLDERWDAVGVGSDLELFFKDWPEPAKEILSFPDQWRKWALCEVPRSARFAQGRVALIGDAAHAMLPFVAQGAAMGIEDALVLARCLGSAQGSIPERLAVYAKDRRVRTQTVAGLARRNGFLYHLNGVAASCRNVCLRTLGPAFLARRMEWIYGWEDKKGRDSLR